MNFKFWNEWARDKNHKSSILLDGFIRRRTYHIIEYINRQELNVYVCWIRRTLGYSAPLTRIRPYIEWRQTIYCDYSTIFHSILNWNIYCKINDISQVIRGSLQTNIKHCFFNFSLFILNFYLIECKLLLFVSISFFNLDLRSSWV